MAEMSDSKETPVKKRCLESTIQRIRLKKRAYSNDDTDMDSAGRSPENSNDVSYEYFHQHIDSASGAVGAECEHLEAGQHIQIDKAMSELDIISSHQVGIHDADYKKKSGQSKPLESVEVDNQTIMDVTVKCINSISPKKEISKHLKVSLKMDKKKFKYKKQIKPIKTIKTNIVGGDDLNKQNLEVKCNMPIDRIKSRKMGLRNILPLEHTYGNKKNVQQKRRKMQTKHEYDELVCEPQEPGVKKAKFHCEICVRDFAKKSLYEKHTRVHTRVRPYKCDVCQKMFRYKHNLTVHGNIHTGMKHKCPVCGKPFPDGCTLRKHELIHVTDHPFVCAVCNRSFSHQFKLTAHERGHTGETPFACSLCDKAYKEKGTLVKHMRTHTGETFFDCSACGKKFAQRCHYTAHMRVHSGDLPFECQFCHRRFREHGQLKRHVKVHYGKRPFRCSVCSRGFVCLKELSKHLKNNSGQGGHVVILTQSKLGTIFGDSDDSEGLLYENNEVPLDSVDNELVVNSATNVMSYDQGVVDNIGLEANGYDNKIAIHKNVSDENLSKHLNEPCKRNYVQYKEDRKNNDIGERIDAVVAANSETVNDKVSHRRNNDTTEFVIGEHFKGENKDLKAMSEQNVEVYIDEDEVSDKTIDMADASSHGNIFVDIPYNYVI